MVQDSTYSAHNYFAHGGSELVIGGQLTFLPGATVEGADGLFDIPTAVIPHIAASEATTVAALKDQFNALLIALQTAGLMAAE